MSTFPTTFEPANYVDVMFLEDVRQESNGKNLFIGVFGPMMIVPSFPFTVRQLIARMSFTTSPDAIPHSLRFVVHVGGKPVREVTVPAQDLANAKAERAKIKPKGDQDVFLRVNSFVDLARLEISGPCRIATYVEAGGRAYRGTSLEVLDDAEARQKGIGGPVAPTSADAESNPGPAQARPERPRRRPTAKKSAR